MLAYANPVEHPAILYLKQWKNDNKNWRFQKVRQVYLEQNILDIDLVSPPKLQIRISSDPVTDQRRGIRSADRILENRLGELKKGNL
jgi:hypothetical protein